MIAPNKIGATKTVPMPQASADAPAIIPHKSTARSTPLRFPHTARLLASMADHGEELPVEAPGATVAAIDVPVPAGAAA